MKRAASLAYGAACYLGFLAAFAYAVGFVGDAVVPRTVDAGGPRGGVLFALVVDTSLLGLFAIQHSVMARSGFKRLWTRIVPAPLERSTYVLLSSACLFALFYGWHPIPAVVWHVEHPLGAALLQGLSLLGWAIATTSTYLIDHFELFGLRQVSRTTAPAAQRFRTPLLYRIVRHPLYLGFIVAFWATPTMTVGHLLFATAMLGYILVAVRFEERDLVREHGDAYRDYRLRVRSLVPLPRRR